MATIDDKTINEDNTYYENVLPIKTVNQHQKQKNPNQVRHYATTKSLYSQNKMSEPKFSDSKRLTTQSLPGGSLKYANLKLNNKHTKESVASKQVGEITTSVKCVAAAMFLGLIVLLVAVGLTIYFMVLKKGTEEDAGKKDLMKQAASQVTTQSPYGLVEPPPHIPSNLQVKSMCDMLTNFLPKFDFATYGNHTFETIENFLEIRNVYLKKVKKQDRTILVENGLKMTQNLLILFQSIRKGLNLKTYVENWARCENEKTGPRTKCGEFDKRILKETVLSYVETSFSAYNASVVCSEVLQKVSSTAMEIASLGSASERLASHLFGFKKFFQALYHIYFTQNRLFNILVTRALLGRFDNRQFACLFIIDETLDDLSNIIEPYFMKAIGNAKPLGTHWDTNKMVRSFRQISTDLMKNSENRIKTIIDQWKKSTT